MPSPPRDLETRNGAAQSEPRHTKKEEVRTRYLRDVGMLYGDRGSAVPALWRGRLALTSRWAAS